MGGSGGLRGPQRLLHTMPSTDSNQNPSLQQKKTLETQTLASACTIIGKTVQLNELVENKSSSLLLSLLLLILLLVLPRSGISPLNEEKIGCRSLLRVLRLQMSSTEYVANVAQLFMSCIRVSCSCIFVHMQRTPSPCGHGHGRSATARRSESSVAPRNAFASRAVAVLRVSPSASLPLLVLRRVARPVPSSIPGRLRSS